MQPNTMEPKPITDLFRDLSRRTKILLLLGLVLVIAAVIVLLGMQGRKNLQAAAYDEQIRAGLESMPSLDFMTGGGLVAYNTADKRYVDQYIPDSLKPSDPADVRGVVRFSYGEVKVGTYSTGGGGAYKRTIEVSIYDAVTGSMFPGAYITIQGGDPPGTVSGPAMSNRYGSYPSESEVKNWISRKWSNLAYHRMMREAFGYGQPHSYGLGEKLVMLDGGEFTKNLLPAELAAADPTEVGAIVRYDAKYDYGPDHTGKNIIEWTDHTLAFVSLLTGEPIEGLETTLRSRPKENKIKTSWADLSTLPTWDEIEKQITRWIAETWADYQQR